MQKGVLIKKNGVLVDKRVYAGDTSNLDKMLVDEGVNYEIFDDTDPLFSQATLEITKTQEQLDWETAKATETALVFLGKKLGLE